MEMDAFIAEQTLSRNETPSGESFNQRMFGTALLFDEFCTPILCLFGILGNLLSLVVFSTDSKYKNKSAPLYLSALSISDTGYLLSLLAVWLEGVVDGGSVITTSDFSCSLFMYLGQVTCFMSVYLTVVFTIERFMVVQCPLSNGRTFTRAKAKRCVTVLSIISLLICSYAGVIAKLIEYPLQTDQTLTNTSSTSEGRNIVHHFADNENISVFMTSAMTAQDGHQTVLDQSAYVSGNVSDWNMHHHEGEYGYICSVPEQFHEISEIANYCDTIITFVIPFLLITFFNIRIAACVWRLRKQRQGIIASPTRNTSGNSNSDSLNSFLSGDVKTNETFKLQPGRLIHRLLSRNPGISHHQMVLIESRRNKDGGNDRVFQGNEVEGETSGFRNAQRVHQSGSCFRSHYDSPEIHVTKTLLLVSSVFLVLNLPSHLIRCALFIQDVTGTKEGQETLRALQPWANILFNTNFSVNFLLYCVSGKSFRCSMQNLVMRTLCRQQHPHMHTNHHHHHHRMGKMIKEELDQTARYHSRMYSTAATMAMTTDGMRDINLCIELGNGNKVVVHESVSVENNGNGHVKYSPADEYSVGGAIALELEQTSSV